MRHERGNEFFMQEGARHAHDSWWDGPLHAIVLVLLLALLIGGVVWLLRRLSPSVAQAATPAVAGGSAAALAADPAVSTLRMRYAKGEISRDDYRAAFEDLTGAATSAEEWPGEETATTERMKPAGEIVRVSPLPLALRQLRAQLFGPGRGTRETG